MAVCLRDVVEPAIETDQGDGRVARDVAHMCPASVLIIAEVPGVMKPVLDLPVSSHQGGERSGGRRGRGAPGKTPFVAAVKTDEKGRPRRMKLSVMGGSGGRR